MTDFITTILTTPGAVLGLVLLTWLFAWLASYEDWKKKHTRFRHQALELSRLLPSKAGSVRSANMKNTITFALPLFLNLSFLFQLIPRRIESRDSPMPQEDFLALVGGLGSTLCLFLLVMFTIAALLSRSKQRAGHALGVIPDYPYSVFSRSFVILQVTIPAIALLLCLYLPSLREIHNQVVASIGTLLLFSVFSFYWFSISDLSLHERGILVGSSLYPWSRIEFYRWYTNCDGVLLGGKPFNAPYSASYEVLIVTLPEESRESLTAIIDEKLAGKRLEDVEEVLANPSEEETKAVSV